MRKILTLVVGLLLLYGQTQAQSRTLTGQINDEQGTPVPNVSITVKGTSIGTTSKTDGTFSLAVPTSAKTLVFSSVGMGLQELPIGSDDVFNVTLKAVANSMQEVVVVAYGTQQKTNVTGSVATVKGAELENKPFTSVDKALQGAVAGLRSASVSGAPGSATSIRIRGVGSLNADANPLWVIDGVFSAVGDFTNNTTTANTLSTLNPDDIESITVLKDAAASSIYGSRAANGVILVTTKKGKAGKTRLNFSAEAGQNSIARTSDNNRAMTTTEYQQKLRESIWNAGGGTTNAEADDILVNTLGIVVRPDVNTNWFDQVTQKGNQSQYNLNITGGTDKTSFYASAGMFSQDGTTIATDFKRYNGQVSISHKATDRITLSAGLNGSTASQRTPANSGNFANPVLASYFLLPWTSPRFDDGSLKYDDPDGDFPVDGGIFNPLIQAAWNKATTVTTSLRGNITGEYKILDNLKFTSRYSGEYFDIQEDSYRNPFYGDGNAQGGDAFAAYRKIFNWTWSNFADYRHNLNKSEDIYFDVKIGYEAQRYKDYQLQAGGQGFPGTLALQYLASAATPTTSLTLPADYSTNSIFSTADINYKDRYVLTGSFRRDGSSVFGANHRWGNFYSVGGTWNITEEEFLKSAGFLSLLKLRASYGENGNSNGFGFYSSLATYSYDANYTGLPGSRPNNVGNPDLTWEKNKIFNVGLDFGLFNNRLSGTVEYYSRTTAGLLASVALSPTTGFTGQIQNVGTVTNKGYEISLAGKPVSGKDFMWEVRFNLAHNTNKITELFNGASVASGFFNFTVGHDAQEFFLRQWAGVDPANGDPLWYTDATKTATTNNYNAAKQALFGSAAPKYFGSLGSTFTYKGISLDVQAVYNFGNYFYDTWDRYLNSDGAFYGAFNQSALQINSWKKAGDIVNTPLIIYGGNKSSYNHSTRYLYKGDYIRIRDLTLGYAIPKTVSQKLHLQNVSIYVRGTNIFTWVKDENLMLDPEAGVGSTNNFDVFIPKTITGGIKIGL